MVVATGKDWQFRIQADQAKDFDDSNLIVSQASTDDIDDLSAIYRRESV